MQTVSVQERECWQARRNVQVAAEAVSASNQDSTDVSVVKAWWTAVEAERAVRARWNVA